MTTAPIPIFVLGIQRSGTTYAANLLAAHPQIAAVTATRHQGVHESVFFSHYARIFGDWADPASREAAVAEFLRSDYAALCCTDADATQRAMLAAPTAGDAFRWVMDAVAARQGADAWLEKSPHHTLLAEDVDRELPNAVFLCITRESADFVRSRLWSFGRVPPPYPRRAALILKACVSNLFHDRYMAGLSHRIGAARVYHLRYTDLRRDPDSALNPFLDALGLDPLKGRRPAFAPNSSFANEAQRRAALTRADHVLIRASCLLARGIPQGLLQALQTRLSHARPKTLPHWVRTTEIAGAGAGVGAGAVQIQEHS